MHDVATQSRMRLGDRSPRPLNVRPILQSWKNLQTHRDLILLCPDRRQPAAARCDQEGILTEKLRWPGAAGAGRRGDCRATHEYHGHDDRALKEVDGLNANEKLAERRSVQRLAAMRWLRK